MKGWNSSTLLVLGAFSVSVLLLFAKSNMRRDAYAGNEVLVSNHIYSPAAADPELRSPERARKMRTNVPRATPTSNRSTVVVNPPSKAPATAATATPAPTKKVVKEKEATHPAYTPQDVPPENVFYVVTATFSSYPNAAKGLENIKRKGFKNAFVGNFDEGKWYSVIGNTFPKEESARFMVKELKEKHGVSAYVYHKKD